MVSVKEKNGPYIFKAALPTTSDCSGYSLTAASYRPPFFTAVQSLTARATTASRQRRLPASNRSLSFSFLARTSRHWLQFAFQIGRPRLHS